MAVRTIAEIIQEMRNFQISRYPLLSTNSPTSVLMMLNESVANQIRKLELALEKAIRDLNIFTAEGSALDALVINWLPEGRLPGSHAEGTVTFYSLNPSTTYVEIPKGTRIAAISKSGTLYFETTEDTALEIGETQASAKARAIAVGSAYNVAAKTITHIPNPIAGVDGVTNNFAFTGGEDEETDDELRRRYIYTIKTAGKATASLISQNLEALSGITQTLCYTAGPGNLQVICDAPDSMGNDLSKLIEQNVAAGITCCGCIAAQIVNGSKNPRLAETWGGKLWVRPLAVMPSQEQITGTCLDQNNNVVNFVATIPAGTAPGDAVMAQLSSNVYVKSVETISYSGSRSYDLMIGLGSYPYLWLKPKEIDVDIQITIKKEPTFESSLEWKIEQSVTHFINSLKIGDDLEFSDLVKAIFQNSLPPYQVFEGIDEIVTCYAVGKGQTIGSFGAVLTVNPDEKIILSSLSVESI